MFTMEPITRIIRIMIKVSCSTASPLNIKRANALCISKGQPPIRCRFNLFRFIAYHTTRRLATVKTQTTARQRFGFLPARATLKPKSKLHCQKPKRYEKILIPLWRCFIKTVVFKYAYLKYRFKRPSKALPWRASSV